MDAEVLNAQTNRIAALLAGDVLALKRWVDEDLVYVSPAGKTMTRPEVFAALRSGSLRIERMDCHDTTVRVFDDCALVGYWADTVSILDGQRTEGRIRSTAVYIKRSEGWKLVSQHSCTMRSE